jgi:GNAT superfamily N-acetyltransferase
MEQTAMIERYQQHLVDALLARIECVEAACGDQFGFEILRHGTATLVLAHRWPNSPEQIPFHRAFHYSAPATNDPDPLLARCIADNIDAIFEVPPGPPGERAGEYLRRHGFTLRWEIPWLDIPIEQFSYVGDRQDTIHMVAPYEMARFADLLVEGYAYTGAQAASWRTFARYGYTALGYHCFIATVEQQPAAFGVLHIRDRTALLDGAATLPRYRGLGLQKALLAARILYARERGCTHAFSRTGLGSISQRNMETLGLRVAGRSTAWRRQYPLNSSAP